MTRRMAGLLEAPATASGGGAGSDIRSAFRSAVASATAGKDVAVRHRVSAKDVQTDEEAGSGDDDEADDGDDDQDDADEGSDDQDEDADEGEDESDDQGEDTDDDADEDADESGEDEGDDEDEDADEQPGERKPAKHALNDEREFRKLQDQYKDDPKGLRRELLKTFTQKTQDIAAKEKQYRGLLSYLPLAEALERNPTAAVKRLAKIYDLKVVDDDGADAGTAKGKAKGRAAATVDDGEDTKAFIDGILKDFKSDLGPELEYLADGLGPAMTKALQKMADRSVSTRVKSLEDATVELARNAGSAESDRVMESFYRSHKDHADYEDDMDELARQLVGEGDNIRPIPMSEGEFLEFLYDTVKARRAASGQKDTIKAEAKRLMKKRLKKLATARSGDRRPASIPEERIRRRPKGNVSIRDAYKAARAGITFDDEDDDGL